MRAEGERGISGRLSLEASATRGAHIAALFVIASLLVLPLVVKLDGRSHADWEQFLGRFHPLAVHIPIGLIVLVPVLEIAGARRRALREAGGLVLALACAACVCALVLGYLLAYGSGATGATVARHMWGGIALSITLLLGMLARPLWCAGTELRLYPTLLTCAMLILVWTAHQGGSLTHGSNYLTEFMPAPLKWIGGFDSVSASAPNPDSFYARRVHPLLDSHCVACHGVGKTQADLRLDTYEGLMRGGKSGAAIVPGNAGKSPVLIRVTLPNTDKYFMPAEGRPSLKPEEITWLRAWIEQGASSTATTVAGVSDMPTEPRPQPVGDYSALMGEIRQMQQGQGAKLVAVSSKPSDGLILNTFDVAASFNDAQLAQFQRFAPYIVEADLARTAITDAGLDTLSKFTHLRVLHLEGTALTGNGLAKLAPLSQLTYLNLSETRLTADALIPLKAMRNLRHVYIFDTPAQPATAADAAQTTGRSAQ